MKTPLLLLKLAALVWLLAPASASAFYNPQSGRWLNRDPILEAGGQHLYGFIANNPLDAVDGDGRLRVTLLSVDSKRCRDYTLKYAFSLDQPAPCDGYFVMENIVYHTDYDCCIPGPFTMKTPPLAHFWEAWEVKKGTSEFEFAAVMDATDTIKGSILKRNRTFRAVVGTLKFYCRSVTGDLGGFASNPGTPQGGWRIGHRFAGLLPATEIPPPWWKTTAVEGPAVRDMTLEGDCCAGPGPIWNLTHDP